MARPSVEPKHLVFVIITAIACFIAMGFLVQAGKSAIYVGVGLVAVAAVITTVLVVVRRRRNDRLMREILDERATKTED